MTTQPNKTDEERVKLKEVFETVFWILLAIAFIGVNIWWICRPIGVWGN